MTDKKDENGNLLLYYSKGDRVSVFDSKGYLIDKIYSDEKDYDVINRFKKVWVMPEECDNCPIRPNCLQLEECPDLPKQVCTDYVLNSYIINAKNRILNTYNEYKTGESQKTDLWD